MRKQEIEQQKDESAECFNKFKEFVKSRSTNPLKYSDEQKVRNQ